jgi:hypothetical protein
LAAPHDGQVLRAGMLSLHELARRLRVFIFDVFFFGTATAGLQDQGCESPIS